MDDGINSSPEWLQHQFEVILMSHFCDYLAWSANRKTATERMHNDGKSAICSISQLAF